MPSDSKKRIVILGATGSVGVNTLKVIERFPERFEVIGLSAYRNVERLIEQARRFHPKKIAVKDPDDAKRLQDALDGSSTDIRIGVEGLIEIATFMESDLVVSAIVGAAGLVPTMAAIQAGKDVALANKETLVMAGRLIMKEASAQGVKILPVDSEHSAIFQCLNGEGREQIRRLILTASGGPFYGLSRDAMDKATPEDALRHPRWDMGPKISIDSATLMNKGLEVIEARWLFDIPVEHIDVRIHPQSIVHSMVEFVDGSVLSQMGIPDMQVPIAYALGYPERLELDLPSLDLVENGPLDFSHPDLDGFPCLALAYEAIQMGGLMPTVLNAANEVAVEAFLKGKIRLTQIPEIINKSMQASEAKEYTAIDEVLRMDRQVRQVVRGMLS